MRVLHSESFCPSQPGFFSLSCAQLVGPFLVIVVGSFVLSLRFMYLSKHIENNFVNIDAQWQNAIDQFFAFDVYSKMMGVRLCMLKFRQFIKWRRFANFFLKLFVASAISFFGLAVALALALHKLQATEVLTSLGFLAGLVLVMRWFLNQRFKHTEWRDPTVQLCVMIAELHQRLIERGATMVEEIDHST
jgi:hypothetical protein